MIDLNSAFRLIKTKEEFWYFLHLHDDNSKLTINNSEEEFHKT